MFHGESSDSSLRDGLLAPSSKQERILSELVAARSRALETSNNRCSRIVCLFVCHCDCARRHSVISVVYGTVSIVS